MTSEAQRLASLSLSDRRKAYITLSRQHADQVGEAYMSGIFKEEDFLTFLSAVQFGLRRWICKFAQRLELLDDWPCDDQRTMVLLFECSETPVLPFDRFMRHWLESENDALALAAGSYVCAGWYDCDDLCTLLGELVSRVRCKNVAEIEDILRWGTSSDVETLLARIRGVMSRMSDCFEE